ncbi:helix-turn-helix domain-containing protein [Paenibacillus sp. sgz500992]|uniref:helix-turn-helix domain-containing protein n=1 Tax=Paenibacillus sp. sgz500992 TaxID=3242476 RepID=UPI0036D2CE7C
MKQDVLKRVFDYIEDHLNEEISLDNVARTGYVSLMQLYREFYCVSGHSIKDYIRKRRISNACAQIKNSGLSITGIALGNGFDSLPSFSKVFKKIVGLTPMEYKRSSVFYTFLPGQFPLHLAETAIKIQSGQPLHGLTAVYLASGDTDIEQQAINALKQAVFTAKRTDMSFRLFGLTPVQVGRSRQSYNLFIDTRNHEYWISALGEAGYHSIEPATLCGGEFAVLSVPFTGSINPAWDYLYSHWLAKSVFTLAGDHCREEFIIQKTGTIKELRLSLPIIRKQSSYIIEVTPFAQQHYIVAHAEGSHAEEEASAKLLSQINQRGFLPSSFYVEITSNGYLCGVEQTETGELSAEDGLSVVNLEAGLYAVLTADSFGDFTGLADIMTGWLEENCCYRRAGSPFALYTVNETYEEVSMKVCIAIGEHSVINGQSIPSNPIYNEDEEQMN